MNQTLARNDTSWQAFYRLAGALALLIVLAGMVDTVTSLGVEVRANSAVSLNEWFTLFQTQRFHAFSALGFINILTLSLSIPIYLALYQAQQTERPVLAALAAVLFILGTTIYLSSNTVFALFAVSRSYAAAGAAQKPLLEAAGSALLAQGADLTPGTFSGFFFTQLGGVLITCVMLAGRVFGKWIGVTGLVGYALTSIFFVLAAFAPESFNLALVFAMPGGLLLLGYHLMLARRFFQLGR